jgi:hypothetical protein
MKDTKVKLHSRLISTLDGSSHFHDLAALRLGIKPSLHIGEETGWSLEPVLTWEKSLSCRKLKLIVQYCRQTVRWLVFPAGYRCLLFNSKNIIMICALKFARARSLINVEQKKQFSGTDSVSIIRVDMWCRNGIRLSFFSEAKLEISETTIYISAAVLLVRINTTGIWCISLTELSKQSGERASEDLCRGIGKEQSCKCNKVKRRNVGSNLWVAGRI